MTYPIEGLTGAEHAQFFGPEWYDEDEEEHTPKLFIFDKDGTLVTKRGGGGKVWDHATQDFVTLPPIPNSVDEQIPLPGVVEKCQKLRAQGHTLAIASNQGGVAWGFLTLQDAQELMRHAAHLVGATWWWYCPHHPKAKGALLDGECNCRKPKPGMLLSIMDSLGFEPADTIMVGDMDTDRQAAEAAGVRFVWADVFFYGDCQEPAAAVGPDVDFR